MQGFKGFYAGVMQQRWTKILVNQCVGIKSKKLLSVKDDVMRQGLMSKLSWASNAGAIPSIKLNAFQHTGA